MTYSFAILTFPKFCAKTAVLSGRGFARCCVMLLLAVGSGCATAPEINLPSAKHWQRALEVPKQISAEQTNDTDGKGFLYLTPEMKAFAHAAVNAEGTSKGRMRRLLLALNDVANGSYIRYDNEATFTAQEAFETRRANCLAFSALFIAMARELGLQPHFQEVDLPPIWAQMSIDTLVQYRHVNVLVELRDSDWVVDFRGDLFKETYPSRRLTDAEALAHHHSNLGMKKLLVSDLGLAFLELKRAIEIAPHISSFWANLGIVHRRLGNLEMAELSYVRALDLDADNHTAMRNLSILYDEQHKTSLAQLLRKQSDATRLRNPYYRYALAQNAYAKGDYVDALELVEFAIKRHSREHKFHYLHGLTLQALGENDAAISSVKRAIKLTDEIYEVSAIENYKNQLQAWLDSGSQY